MGEPTGILVLPPKWTVRVRFKPNDLWVGAYWDTFHDVYSTTFTLWICLVPCFPIEIRRRSAKGET